MTDLDAFRDAEFITEVSGISYGPDEAEVLEEQPAGAHSRHDSRVRKAHTTAKIAFIDRLLRDIDVLIYCELSALYYLDCSVILFALRAVIEMIFFTPKASPFEPTRNQPYVGAIIASNLFCMISHAFFIRPEAGEDTRGYLHGGLFIDFIGQKTPVSVIRLLSLDMLVFVLDFVMLALIVERVKTATPNESTTQNAEGITETEQARSQDHDAEERGVLRQDTNTEEAPDDSSPSPTTENVQEERTTLLAEPGENGPPHSVRDGHPLDQFASGEAVIMDMGFLDTLRDQWQYSTQPRRPSGYVPSTETATFLRQRFGLQVGADGRFVRVDNQ